jgi:hypothetical protein
MSQRSVEILLGKILTDEEFRRSFFAASAVAGEMPNFETVAFHGLELTSVERSALSTLQRHRFDLIARTLDPRISRSCTSRSETLGRRGSGAGNGQRGSS